MESEPWLSLPEEGPTKKARMHARGAFLGPTVPIHKARLEGWDDASDLNEEGELRDDE